MDLPESAKRPVARVVLVATLIATMGIGLVVARHLSSGSAVSRVKAIAQVAPAPTPPPPASDRPAGSARPASAIPPASPTSSTTAPVPTTSKSDVETAVQAPSTTAITAAAPPSQQAIEAAAVHTASVSPPATAPPTTAPRPAAPPATAPPTTAPHVVVAAAPAATPSGYGCAAALSYLATHAAPGFTFECPGNALGHQAMTCVFVAGVCPGARVIAIADPCPAAYMNEAFNSRVAEGLAHGPIDPYGYCRS